MMFKALIGRGHPEFSSMRQQVRLLPPSHLLSPPLTSYRMLRSFFLHLFSTIDKNQRVSSLPESAIRNPADFFRFQFEDRVECVESGKVRYSKRDDFLLQLPVPMSMATNRGI